MKSTTNELGNDGDELGMIRKMRLVSPITATILDRTIGRYQSIQNDPRLVHDFLQACGEELKSLLVNFYESAASRERDRMSVLLKQGQIPTQDQGLLRVDRQVTKLMTRALLPSECYAEGSSTDSGRSGTNDRQSQLATLINQVDSLQVELDVSRSEQNFLRSIASDIIRDLEAKDVTIASLQGCLKRRDAVINEQRSAYIYELLHLREMLRQYREKGRCDLADATLYSWDTNAVQRFQEEEVKSKIDAAVTEARRDAQIERDALEAHFKKQMDDLRRRLAAMSEGISVHSQHRSAMSDSVQVVGEAFEPLEPMLGVSQQATNDERVELPLIHHFTSSLLGATSLEMQQSGAFNDGDGSPLWGGVTVGGNMSTISGSENANDQSRAQNQRCEDKFEFLLESSARRPTQALPSIRNECDASQVIATGNSRSPAQSSLASRGKVSPSHRGAPGIGTPLKSDIKLDGGKLGQRDDLLHSMRERIANRDRLLERLKFILRAVSTDSPSQNKELSLIEDSEALMRRQEQLQDELAKGEHIVSPRPFVARPSSPELPDSKSPSKRGGSQSPLLRGEESPIQSGSFGGWGSRPATTVAFGLTTKTAKSPTEGKAQTEEPRPATELQRQIFKLQSQLSNITVEFEELCLKSKAWYEVYIKDKKHASHITEASAAERRLKTAVKVAELAEEHYRTHRWRVIREGVSYRNCLQNQRRELKEAEATASHRTQLETENHMELLERTLSRKLLWLRHRQELLKSEANEAWDLVLIHAKAVAQALSVRDEDEALEREGASTNRASTTRFLAAGGDVSRDVTEKQLELHREACERRRQFSALAQQRIIEKYAVANVVRRYLNRSTPSTSTSAKEEQPPTSFPRPLSVLSWVSSRPTSASVARPVLPHPEQNPTCAQAECGNADLSEDTDSRQGASRWEATQLDPRCFMKAEAEAERKDRVRSQMLTRSLKGVGVVEKLIQKRIEAAGSNGKPLESTGAVLSGHGYSRTSAEQSSSRLSNEDAPEDLKAPFGTSRPSSSMMRARPMSAQSITKICPSSASRPPTPPILTTSSLVARPASATPSRSSRLSTSNAVSMRNSSLEGARENADGASEFKLLQPSQKREQLRRMMAMDRQLKETQRQKEVASVYAMRSTAVAMRGGSGTMAGQIGVPIGTTGVSRHSSHQSNFVHSKGSNTGAPSAEPFAFAAIGTFTTEDEMKAGIFRSKLVGKGERFAN